MSRCNSDDRALFSLSTKGKASLKAQRYQMIMRTPVSALTLTIGTCCISAFGSRNHRIETQEDALCMENSVSKYVSLKDKFWVLGQLSTPVKDVVERKITLLYII